ncbi:hypothetical protein BDV26DRAFT_291180 [Aspergillus bertholletiae]|uniref:Uncharacterized protein n=1 Tax=Aspergillus bertholletiae TaxID=1226010 RepID=A0A5N7BCU4_9EURO|nr:hypothetical protein BDV26DRAFT_291180 [Aspergillus bertholletiae]
MSKQHISSLFTLRLQSSKENIPTHNTAKLPTTYKLTISTLFYYFLSSISENKTTKEMRVMEVLTTIANNGTINFARLYHTKTENSPVPIDQILKKPSAYRFVFQNPLDLHKLLEDPDPTSVAICQGMKSLRLDLLQPLIEDKLSFIDVLTDRAGLQALMENWRNACRIIPKDHGLEELTFDMSEENEMCQLRATGTTVQIISTTLVLKARQDLRCWIQGVSSSNHVHTSLVSR